MIEYIDAKFQSCESQKEIVAFKRKKFNQQRL